MKHDTLLENAISSIRLGLDDFKADDTRVISAVRNLYSGILLLCKEVLNRNSPEDSEDLFIKKKTKLVKDKNGKIIMKGDGKNTIDISIIQKLFKSLKLKVNLSTLQKLADIRNDVEHSYSSKTSDDIKKAVANCLPIIRDIIVNELEEKPRELLGAKAWGILLEEPKIFNQQKKDCNESFSTLISSRGSLDWILNEISCQKCSSSMMENRNKDNSTIHELNMFCSECEEHADIPLILFEIALEKAYTLLYADKSNYPFKSPVEACPNCEVELYVLIEDRCVSCDFTIEGVGCEKCGNQINLDECNGGIPSLCTDCEYELTQVNCEQCDNQISLDECHGEIPSLCADCVYELSQVYCEQCDIQISQEECNGEIPSLCTDCEYKLSDVDCVEYNNQISIDECNGEIPSL